ncbi:MAG: AMIN domain-containing protein, partial [Pseudohongiellaceae bacterium]
MKRLAIATLSMTLFLTGMFSSSVSAQTTIEDIEFVSLPGDQFQVELTFSQRPPEPEVFLIENPARLSMDFSDVVSRLDSRRYPLDFNNADSIIMLEAQGRTRMVVNLMEPTAYETSIQGNSLFVTIGSDVAAGGGGAVLAAAQAAAPAAQAANAGTSTGDIRNIDFRRNADGAGQIMIDLANSGL